MLFLKKLNVENFRSLDGFGVSFNSLNIIVGKNDAGKSNILRALRLLLDDGMLDHITPFDWTKDETKKRQRYPRIMIIQADFSGDDEYSLRRRIILSRSPDGKKTRGIEKRSVLEIKSLADPDWRAANDEDQQRIPSFYYFRPRTGLLEDGFDIEKENQIFTLIKSWMPKDLGESRHFNSLMRKVSKTNSNIKNYALFFEHHVIPILVKTFPFDFPKNDLDISFRGEHWRNVLLVREFKNTNDATASFWLPIDNHGTGLTSLVAMIIAIVALKQHHVVNLSNKPLLVAVRSQDIANCFESSSYFGGVPGHREPCEAFLW